MPDKTLIETIRRETQSPTFQNSSPFWNMIKPHLSKEYIMKMEALGDKYKDVRWLPLDIPKIEIEDMDAFKDLWEKESAPILRTKPDVAEPWDVNTHPLGSNSSYNRATFNGLTLYQNELSKFDDATFSQKLYTGNDKQFKRLVEQVLEYYPVHTAMTIFIWQSTRIVHPHRDNSFYWKCPTEFRTMLYDENDEPTLYVADIDKGDVNYINLPEDTNTFCWSNGTQIHGSDYHGKKKWLLCFSGIQHSKKSADLFERSVIKYKDKLNYDLKINL